MRIQDISAELERVLLGGAVAQRNKLTLKFERTLEEGGIHRALAFLNSRVPHRFTSVCRFDPPMLRGVFAFDREQSGMLLGGRTHVLDETYAVLVQKRKQRFITENAARDSRLLFHYARATTGSYVGVPIRLPSGEMWGVLAHHDALPRRVPSIEVDVLEEVTSVIARWLRPESIGDLRTVG